MSHSCHAKGCDMSTPPTMFMCRHHWYMLPKPMREAIWATYRPGQEHDKRPSPEYLHNARSAIAFIAECEAGQPKIENGVAMPAVTIWQPWAALISIGAKPFEFRSWRAPATHHGKRIAIHAGARAASKNEMRELLLRLHSSHWRETGLVREPAIAFLEKALTSPSFLPLGAVVCTAVLGPPIRNSEMERALGLQPVNDSDRDEHSNWGWPLSDVRVLVPPIPARGAMGFFKVMVPA